MEFSFQEKLYEFIQDRRNGTKIYRAKDHSHFLRIGPKTAVEKELAFHKQLIEKKYPVPVILEQGEVSETESYFCESSVGEHRCSILLQNDLREHGKIQPKTFDAFLHIIARYLGAQKNDSAGEKNWESVFLATHFDVLLEELPEKESTIMAVWEKIKIDLIDVPFVLCHGDFNAANIFPDGVIDFETAFEGPWGYDLVSAALTFFWFPQSGDFEFLARYTFTKEEIMKILKLTPEIISFIDALFVLRSVWAVVRMENTPKIQAWRYEKFEKIMEDYLKDTMSFLMLQ